VEREAINEVIYQLPSLLKSLRGETNRAQIMTRRFELSNRPVPPVVRNFFELFSDESRLEPAYNPTWATVKYEMLVPSLQQSLRRRAEICMLEVTRSLSSITFIRADAFKGKNSKNKLLST
jgi:hypothetical protein